MSLDNKFQTRLLAGPTQLGTWLKSASATCAEADINRALSATPAGTITRVPWNDAVVVKRVLDAGAQTLM